MLETLFKVLKTDDVCPEITDFELNTYYKDEYDICMNKLHLLPNLKNLIIKSVIGLDSIECHTKLQTLSVYCSIKLEKLVITDTDIVDISIGKCMKSIIAPNTKLLKLRGWSFSETREIVKNLEYLEVPHDCILELIYNKHHTMGESYLLTFSNGYLNFQNECIRNTKVCY